MNNYIKIYNDLKKNRNLSSLLLFIKFINKNKSKDNKLNEPREIILNENINTISNILPRLSNNSKKYRFTDISLYSLTPKDQSLYLIEIIKSFFKNIKKLTILEANGCIGGNTWSFAKYFNEVNVIELDKLHFEILIYNMKLLGYKNIIFYNGNILDYLYSFNNDVIFFDPPWGGISYKNKKNKILCGYYYNNIFIPIDIIVTDKNYSNKLKMIILKIPLNYNMNYMKKHNIFKYYYEFIISNNIKKIYKIIIFSNYKKLYEIKDKKMLTFKFKNLKYHYI